MRVKVISPGHDSALDFHADIKTAVEAIAFARNHYGLPWRQRGYTVAINGNSVQLEHQVKTGDAVCVAPAISPS